MAVGTGLMEKGTPTTTTANAGPFLPARTRSLEEEAVEKEEEEATEAEVPRHGNLLPLLLLASWCSSSSLASPTGLRSRCGEIRGGGGPGAGRGRGALRRADAGRVDATGAAAVAALPSGEEASFMASVQ